jgi:histidyl-tRNA synthetase
MLGGTPDSLADRFAHVVETFERVRKLYGFRRIEVPVFEQTAVFARSLGESTDVVSKEMYSVRGSRRRFGDAAARVHRRDRARLPHQGWQQYAPLKVATHGPLFRYERPQKGRYRQFHQVDAEIIGAAEPLADVELLSWRTSC